jgi:RNA polymerase sigma factor (TIGR02999 family)
MISTPDSAADAMPEQVYLRLRRLAARIMRAERAGHTLQPTALVHEALLRLEPTASTSPRESTRYVSNAAFVMRRVLADAARRRRALRRGGDRSRVPLGRASPGEEIHHTLRLDLEQSLERLRRHDPQLARIVVCRCFESMTTEETARVLKVSTRTIERGWRFARLWLCRELDPER